MIVFLNVKLLTGTMKLFKLIITVMSIGLVSQTWAQSGSIQFIKRGNTIHSYSAVGKNRRKLGSYAFKGKLQYVAHVASNRFLVAKYRVGESTYLGAFNQNMEYLGEYKFGRKLKLHAFRPVQSFVFVFYTDQGHQTHWVGKFSIQMKYIGQKQITRAFDQASLTTEGRQLSLNLITNNAATTILYDINLRANQDRSTPATIEKNRATGLTQPYKYDPNARPRFATKSLAGYRVAINNLNGRAYFYSPKGRTSSPIATYNWKRQYWEAGNEAFLKTRRSKIRLEKLFVKIDLSMTKLNRLKPQAATLQSFLYKETKHYDYSNDADFAEFIAYLKKKSVSTRKLNFYLKAANNPAKRGAIKPYNLLYEEIEVGIQQETMKPISLKNKPAVSKKWLKIAGGMQYYFELRKRDYARSADQAYNIFRDNNVVPLTIVELYDEGKKFAKSSLTGAKLRKEISKDLKDHFGKKFNIKSIKQTINYDHMLKPKFIGLKKKIPAHMWNTLPKGKIMDEYAKLYINPQIKRESLVIYYFVHLPKLPSNPLELGIFTGNWKAPHARNLHEFGHALGLRHIFSAVEKSDDISSHIAPAGIMSYKFKNNEFSELVLYGLGL